MPFFSDKAIEKNRKKNKRRNIIMLTIGAGSFAATGLISISKNIVGGFTQDLSKDATEQRLQANQNLIQKEAGALIVLEREPNNPNALKSLAEARIALEDYEGALEPLDQLLGIFPNNQKFQEMRSQAEQNLNSSSESGTTTEK
ncbi:hypothetical protein Lepto7376_1702 [[Leptolyngbya] sp. PCC 7376]|uniref:tetratricopeptide repeat protein n=1 Tax=[Leptolyngbya] sp. PCC 7376 TaxID=111781 RepID=UPI00029F01CD|nr:tetratricopeptide repeat protein [[Leptolyngbya] sp. PCC 7376]AFY38036.1 hypothetical protein Lepto7376_1702 [[Leptolyngbya] sp. PCC 7376]